MNPITLHIVYSDGSKVTTTANAPDFVAFESKYDKSVQSFATDVRLTYMFFLAWHSLKRTAKTDVDFDAWLETISDIAVDDPKA